MTDEKSPRESPRVYKPEHPKGILLGAGILGVLVLVAIIFATTYMVRTIEDARLTGTVIEKNFTPQPERRITLGRDGVTASDRAGQFQIRVEVPMRDGATEEFVVSNLTEERWNRIEVGDTFDVGPYLIGPVRAGEGAAEDAPADGSE